MKTSRYNILLVLWALMLLVACSDSSSDESEKPVAPSITLDTEIPPVIVAEGGTVAVGFKASADWTAPVTNRGASCRLLRAKPATLL